MSCGPLQWLSVAELTALYDRRELSPLEYHQYLIDHVQRREPALNALSQFTPELVLEQAAASTQRWARGAPLGPLDGVPVTLKSLIATRGQLLDQGCAGLEPRLAVADAPPAARLREAGVVLLGKTCVPDFGMLSSGLSSLHGITRNPWNTALNPGGSSAGAAAAAAAGYGPLHLGTDIGGSVRLPAGWCALVGFKPTLGRIPIDPYYTGRCAGPMTRTVDDCAAMMAVLARPDLRDATSLPAAELDWGLRPMSVRGLRVGLLLEPGCGLQPDAQTCAAVRAAAALFEAQGARLVEVKPLMERRLLDGLDRFWRARQWSELRQLEPERLAQVLPYIRQWAEPARHMTAVEAVEGFNQTFEMRRRAARLFEQCDLLLSPTNQVQAYPAELASPGNDPQLPFEHIVFTVPWNMGEQPALSINCGFNDQGMPIGLQMVAPRFADTWLLRLAKAFETWRGPIRHWPE
ncbi:amidase [Pseudomonas inefficax]|uniref:amidase n=1 Tax=Pseudomonas inefficax TaxID=2078786 RepID=UPI00207BA546|nr:amidase [Pseudomonas inefficax]MCM8911411.1 amidase [Pseudomonas inefficax]